MTRVENTDTQKDRLVRVMAVLCVVAMMCMAFAVELGYPSQGDYVVYAVEKVRKNDMPEYHVHTDHGTFLIEMRGANAYPYGINLIGRDLPRVVRMKTRGARIESIGVYPNIIYVFEEESL